MSARRLFLLTLLSAWLEQEHAAALRYVLEENRVLRELVGKRRVPLTDAHRRRLGMAARAVGRKLLAEIAQLAKPATLLGWYRRLVAAKYASSASAIGRPRAQRASVTTRVLQFARENPSWGYTRIRQALYHLGHEVGRSTIARILMENGVTPAPTRRGGMSWSTFLALHWGHIAAADFFTVEVLTVRGLVRYTALVVMDLKSRRVELAGLTRSADGAWTGQLARNLTDGVDGFLLGTRKLLVDRDPLFQGGWARVMRGSGVELVRLPPRSPNLNAHVERVIRSIKEECLAHVIPLGEAHLRHVLTEYLAHYHAERHHQGLGGRLIAGAPAAPPGARGRVRRRQRLGGLLNYYEREAA